MCAFRYIVEKAAMSPNVPTGRPATVAAWAWLQSSTTRMSRALAAATICSISHAWPREWTITAARVWGLTRSLNCAVPMLKRPGWLSASRGRSRLRMIALIAPGSVMGETSTSLPSGSSSAARATKRAEVPVATASAYPPPIMATKASVYIFSNEP